MVLSPDERERFLSALRTDESFRASVRREVLTDELLALPERVASLEAAVTRLEGVLTDLFTVSERHEETLAALVAVSERHEADLAALIGVTRRHEDDLARLKGFGLEHKLASHPGGYLAAVLRRPQVLQEADLYELVPDQADDVLLADLVVRARWRADGEPTLAVIEASWRVHSDDLDRAHARATLLARATGERVVPIALSGEEPGEAVRDRAAALGVALLLPGSKPALVEGTPVRAA